MARTNQTNRVKTVEKVSEKSIEKVKSDDSSSGVVPPIKVKQVKKISPKPLPVPIEESEDDTSEDESTIDESIPILPDRKMKQQAKNREKYLKDPDYFRIKNAKSRAKKQQTFEAFGKIVEELLINEKTIRKLNNPIVNTGLASIRVLRGLDPFVVEEVVSAKVDTDEDKKKTKKKKVSIDAC